MAFEVEIIHEKSADLDAFLTEYGTVFHRKIFLDAVGSDYQCIIVKENHGIIIGALPLVKTSKFGLTAFHIPPFTYEFGPILSPIFQKHKGEILGLLLKNLPKSSLFDFKLFINDQDLIPFKENGYSISVSQTHVFPSDQTFNETILAKNKKQDILRLLKLEKSGGIRIVENDINNLDLIIKLQIETARRAGFKLSLEKLNKIFSCGLPNYNNIILDFKGNPLAGTFCPFDQTTMYHLIGASRRTEEKSTNTSNYLSLFLAISYANNKRLIFDFEGSNLPGISKFYRMMGGQPKFIYRLQKSNSLYFQLLKFGEQYLAERK